MPDSRALGRTRPQAASVLRRPVDPARLLGRAGPSNRLRIALGARTLLEDNLQYRELSLLVQRDRRLSDPVLSAHRWWARRPPAVFRGLLLSAALAADEPIASFWQKYSSAAPELRGWNVYDAFVGGGTTLVEAARLGAKPYGTDVDPIAVMIVKHALSRPDVDTLRSAAAMLVTFLQNRVGHLFFEANEPSVPLYYFYLRRVSCPGCGRETPLYRDLILAQRSGKDGSVHREHALEVFCPDCYAIHHYSNDARVQLRCCRRRRLSEGTFRNGKFRCPECGASADHKQLKTGLAPAKLIAVEETTADGLRRFRPAGPRDRSLLAESDTYLREHSGEMSLPKRSFAAERFDGRPVSFGVSSPRGLFSPRQLALFGHAFRWIEESDSPDSIKRALRLAISHSLTTNNMLCGYARDYGRLAPLFSVRSYALPSLSVELNPFHLTGGRGTIQRNIDRLLRSVANKVTRHVWDVSNGQVERRDFQFETRIARPQVACMSAADADFSGTGFDIALFDPPYFDYIAYSELSEFYRVWWPRPSLGGAPLIADGQDAVKSFADGFGACLRNTITRTKARGLIVFTFHSASAKAWEAVGLALDGASLTVTALWPVLTDPHMGHHSYAGNCEWDLVVVTRRTDECEHRGAPFSVDAWRSAVAPLKVRDADVLSMNLAVQMAQSRYGRQRDPSIEAVVE